jgi:hypothetical protein
MAEQTQVIHPTRRARRDAVRNYLKDHPERSNAWAAKDTGSSGKMVEVTRRELEAQGDIPTLAQLIDINGKARPRSVQRAARPAHLEIFISVQDEGPALISARRGKRDLGAFAVTKEGLPEKVREILGTLDNLPPPPPPDGYRQ